jgi:hypothetical protein
LISQPPFIFPLLRLRFGFFFLAVDSRAWVIGHGIENENLNKVKKETSFQWWWYSVGGYRSLIPHATRLE